MFYQYPWWHFYGDFSAYVSRLSQMLTGGRHVAKVAVLWPINDIFATYTPQSRNEFANRTERDFDTLTDLLLRLHHDFDYLDEDMLAESDIDDAAIRIRDEAYELLIVPPMRHIKLSTLAALEQFVEGGGRLLGMVFLPDTAFGDGQLIDIRERVQKLFGVDPTEAQQTYTSAISISTETVEHGSGRGTFLRSYALNRGLPFRLQEASGTPGQPESGNIVLEEVDGRTTYWHAGADGQRQEITAEVNAEREEVMQALGDAIARLIEPDVVIDNAEVFYLHRIKDDRDFYFLVNPTYQEQPVKATLSSECRPVLWDASTGEERPIVPWCAEGGKTTFEITLPPTGSAFVVAYDPVPSSANATNAVVTSVTADAVSGYVTGTGAQMVVGTGAPHRLDTGDGLTPECISLEDEWEFRAEDENALVINHWMATESPMKKEQALDTSVTDGWLRMVPGAWAYQLPAEPSHPYPVDVWYRATFEADYVPPSLHLIIDGFAGSAWTVYVNGQQVCGTAERSGVDSQMQQLDITSLAATGENVVFIGLTVTGPTDGLLDLLKITGHFALEEGDSGWRIVAPDVAIQPAFWTVQGYPFYSGRGVYRRSFTILDHLQERRVILDPGMIDDVVEVVINGTRAGVRLWAPYEVDITDFVKPGENMLELRVANTLINLLEAVQRPSGLGGAPRIALYQQFSLDLPSVEPS
jgi:hypothetical protein